MARWTGESITMQVGPKWTYKLRLERETEAGPQSQLVLGSNIFDTQEDARMAGEAHLEAEIDARSS